MYLSVEAAEKLLEERLMLSPVFMLTENEEEKKYRVVHNHAGESWWGGGAKDSMYFRTDMEMI
jgi:hypothetical protein